MNGGRKVLMNIRHALGITLICRRRLVLLLMAAAGGLFTGCAAVGPDYRPPETVVAEQWRNEGPIAIDEDRQNLVFWWRIFDDSCLNQLIEQAIADNLGIRETVSRVEQARLQQRLAGADRYPALTGDGAVRFTEARGEDDQSTSGERFSAAISVGWEIDLFGGVARAIEAADADYQARVEDLRAATVSLLADVARSYFEARSYQARLEVAEAEVQSRQETMALVDAMHRAGRADALAVTQAASALAGAKAAIPTLEVGLEAACNRLAILLGRPPGTLHAQLAVARPLPRTTIAAVIGVPADVLRQRPDIRRAERELAAQTARVGVAEAARYPHFRLTGSIGLEALSLSNLLATPARSVAIGPVVSWPLFDAGALRTAVQISNEVQRQAALAYESAVLTALGEVEDALYGFAKEQERLERIEAVVAADQLVLELAEFHYQVGLADFSEVLDAQRSRLSSKNQHIQSTATVATGLVELYRALGGGWQSFVPPATQEPLSQTGALP